MALVSSFPLAPSTLLRPAWNVLQHRAPSGTLEPHTVSQRVYNEHVIVCRGPTPLSFHVSSTDRKMSLSVQLATSSQSKGATCSASRWRNRTRLVPEMLPPSPHPAMGLTPNSGMCLLPFKLEPSGFVWHTFLLIFLISLNMMLLTLLDAVCSLLAFVVESSVVSLHPTIQSVMARRSSGQ